MGKRLFIKINLILIMIAIMTYNDYEKKDYQGKTIFVCISLK